MSERKLGARIYSSFESSLNNVRNFYNSHKTSTYVGFFVGVTAITAAVGSYINQDSRDPFPRIIIASSDEFQISYQCVPNKSSNNRGKHTEVTVTSPTYRTSTDPGDLLVIWWDKSNKVDRFRNEGYGAVDPKLFNGIAMHSFEDSDPLGNAVDVEVVKSILPNPSVTSGGEVLSALSGKAPRYC